METTTVNISFKKDLLKQIDKIAQGEARSRSELIREAARAYIERKNRWDSIFDFGDKQVVKLDLSPEDVPEEISKYRKRQRA
jgi:metal-responsive CopG/Arc/MetJ family transcriptional regulator